MGWDEYYLFYMDMMSGMRLNVKIQVRVSKKKIISQRHTFYNYVYESDISLNNMKSSVWIINISNQNVLTDDI